MVTQCQVPIGLAIEQPGICLAVTRHIPVEPRSRTQRVSRNNDVVCHVMHLERCSDVLEWSGRLSYAAFASAQSKQTSPARQITVWWDYLSRCLEELLY